MKFLLKNNCSLTIKDQRGDTIKDYIYRYLLKEKQFISLYQKYESRALIRHICSQSSIQETLQSFNANVKWQKIFFVEMYKMASQYLFSKFNGILLFGYYFIIYVLHWFFVDESVYGQQALTMIFHLILILIGVTAFFFYKASTGSIDKKHISKDRNSSLLGQLLFLMENRQLHKIEELSKRYCYECLIIKSKHSNHCSHCN